MTLKTSQFVIDCVRETLTDEGEINKISAIREMRQRTPFHLGLKQAVEMLDTVFPRPTPTPTKVFAMKIDGKVHCFQTWTDYVTAYHIVNQPGRSFCLIHYIDQTTPQPIMGLGHDRDTDWFEEAGGVFTNPEDLL